MDTMTLLKPYAGNFKTISKTGEFNAIKLINPF